MFDKEAVKLLVTMLLSNLQGMKRNIDHNIQSKMLSRWGLSNNQILKSHNLLSEQLIEQMGAVSMLLKNGFEEEKPMDVAGALAKVLGKAPQTELDAPPGWTKDADGNWVNV